jgi:hypothetical protein
MRLGVLHRGRPVGAIDITNTEPFMSGVFELASSGQELAAIVDLHWRAVSGLGYLGSIDDEGDRRGAAATAAYEALCQELELQRPDGSLSGFAIGIIFRQRPGEGMLVTLEANDEEGGAPVGAQLRPPPRSGGAEASRPEA